MAEACGSRTHLRLVQSRMPDLKSGRPRHEFQRFWCLPAVFALQIRAFQCAPTGRPTAGGVGRLAVPPSAREPAPGSPAAGKPGSVLRPSAHPGCRRYGRIKAAEEAFLEMAPATPAAFTFAPIRGACSPRRSRTCHPSQYVLTGKAASTPGSMGPGIAGQLVEMALARPGRGAGRALVCHARLLSKALAGQRAAGLEATRASTARCRGMAFVCLPDPPMSRAHEAPSGRPRARAARVCAFRALTCPNGSPTSSAISARRVARPATQFGAEPTEPQPAAREHLRGNGAAAPRHGAGSNARIATCPTRGIGGGGFTIRRCGQGGAGEPASIALVSARPVAAGPRLRLASVRVGHSLPGTYVTPQVVVWSGWRAGRMAPLARSRRESSAGSGAVLPPLFARASLTPTCPPGNFCSRSHRRSSCSTARASSAARDRETFPGPGSLYSGSFLRSPPRDRSRRGGEALIREALEATPRRSPFEIFARALPLLCTFAARPPTDAPEEPPARASDRRGTFAHSVRVELERVRDLGVAGEHLPGSAPGIFHHQRARLSADCCRWKGGAEARVGGSRRPANERFLEPPALAGGRRNACRVACQHVDA